MPAGVEKCRCRLKQIRRSIEVLNDVAGNDQINLWLLKHGRQMYVYRRTQEINIRVVLMCDPDPSRSGVNTCDTVADCCQPASQVTVPTSEIANLVNVI